MPTRTSGWRRSHAYRMPTTSMASADSRHTMKSALPMARSGLLRLLGDDLAPARGFLELVEERVLARLERAHVDGHRLARRNHLFLLEVLALELDGLLALVGNLDPK